MATHSRELVQSASRGDTSAVEQLLVRHLDSLHAYVRLRVGGVVAARESASDLVQSVCREVLQDLHAFDYQNDEHFVHWLYTTALRKIRDRGRFHGRQRRDAGREVAADDGALLGAYATMQTPSRDAAANEEIDRFEVAFTHLSEEQQEVVSMARLMDLPHADIARHLGKSEGAVRVVLHRALARLARLMRDGTA